MNSYHAFLIRYWQENATSSEQLPGWRFALVEIAGGSKTTIGFANFDLLVAFLAGKILGEPSTGNFSHTHEQGGDS